MLFVNEREEVRVAAHAFRRAQHKIAIRVQGIMENWNALSLQLWAKIDKNVATRNEIDTGKRRVLADVLPSESAHITDAAADLVVSICRPRKKATKPGGGDTFGDRFRINSRSGLGDDLFAHICAEDLRANIVTAFAQRLENCNRHRIDLLAG